MQVIYADYLKKIPVASKKAIDPSQYYYRKFK